MRFSTMENIKADQLDFVPRHRHRQIPRIIACFLLIDLLICITTFVYVPSPVHLAPYITLATVFFIAMLCLYVVSTQQKNLDLVMAAEFQNMLFSQSLALGSAFSMILRRDGSIVHTSDNFDQIFPHFDYATSQALEGVFEQGTVRKLDRDRILSAIHSGQSERLVFPVITQYSEKKDYIITVEPLKRPAGFCLLRGREYFGTRKGTQLMPEPLRSTSIDKLEHLLTTTNTGLYATDQYGRFEYVNPAFELMLGYAPGLIIENKLSLHHLFFSFNGEALTEEYSIGNYSGPAVGMNKMHGRIPAEIRQNVIRDGNGKAIGATGSLFTAAA